VSQEFDVVCLGGGVAGEAIAAGLQDSGLTLAVVERELVGGECPYWGCVPSKTLLRSGETLTEAGRARVLAASRVEWNLDFPKVSTRVRWMARNLDDSRPAAAMEATGARLFRGEGKVTDPRTVTVGSEELVARRAVVRCSRRTGVRVVMRSDIIPGAAFPDYELSDHRGSRRTLSELQQSDPLVLVLSRGGFCPKERRQHEGLLQLHREMQVGYCRLVTLSTDNLLQTNEFRAGVGAQWTFLSDPGRKVQKDLDIAEYTDSDHNPMIPHTLVLEPGLRVYKIYTGYWFFGRPTVEELRLDLRAVLQRCRPDWDISSAEQRTTWANGDKAKFYPYGKTQAQVFAERD